MVKIFAWWLPRPRTLGSYRGGFPLHFEIKLLRFLGRPKKVLHSFGGLAEHGLRVDLLKSVEPEVIADAHNLPFKDETFDCVVLDPPYSDKYAKKMYGTPELHYNKYINEAIRVTKIKGFIVHYHFTLIGHPKNCYWYAIILLATRTWHKIRCICIFTRGVRKEEKTLLEVFS